MSVHFLWTLMLVGMQSYQISIARTTNEISNAYRLEYFTHPDDVNLEPWKKRDYNPFDMGFFRNCADFWSGGGRYNDWFTTYRVPTNNKQIV